jgi:hypothetical protein
LIICELYREQIKLKTKYPEIFETEVIKT